MFLGLFSCGSLSFGRPLSASLQLFFMISSYFWRIVICCYDISICDCLFLYWLPFPFLPFFWKWSIWTKFPSRSLSISRKFLRHVMETFYFCWMVILRGGQGMGFSVNCSEAIVCFTSYNRTLIKLRILNPARLNI